MNGPKSLVSCIQAVLPKDQQWKYTLLEAWNTSFGQLRSRAFIEKIYDSTVVIAVYDACWLQELYLLSDTLVTQINATLDKPYIKQIRFKRAGRSYQPQKTPPPRKAVPIPSKHHLSADERQALLHVKDPQLAAMLEKFLNRCTQQDA